MATEVIKNKIQYIIAKKLYKDDINSSDKLKDFILETLMKNDNIEINSKNKEECKKIYSVKRRYYFYRFYRFFYKAIIINKDKIQEYFIIKKENDYNINYFMEYLRQNNHITVKQFKDYLYNFYCIKRNITLNKKIKAIARQTVSREFISLKKYYTIRFVVDKKKLKSFYEGIL